MCRSDAVKAKRPASLRAEFVSRARSIMQAYLGIKNAVSSTKSVELTGKRVHGKERSLSSLRRKPKGTAVDERETGGAVRPCNTNSPSATGKGRARRSMLCGKGLWFRLNGCRDPS